MRFNSCFLFLFILTHVESILHRINQLSYHSDPYIKHFPIKRNPYYFITSSSLKNSYNKNRSSFFNKLGSTHKSSSDKSDISDDSIFLDSSQQSKYDELVDDTNPKILSLSQNNSDLKLSGDYNTQKNLITNSLSNYEQNLQFNSDFIKLKKSLKLVDNKESGNLVRSFLNRFNLLSSFEKFKVNAKYIKSLINSFLYPKGANDKLVKYINWKNFERFLLTLSSSIASNVKPFIIPELNQGKKDIFVFFKSKFTGAKMTTLLITTLFKDVFSRILNYYWFNRFVKVSDAPRAFRVLSTVSHSILTSCDFLFNLFEVEPKSVLTSITNVFRQLFLLTHNSINQFYYNKYFEDGSGSKTNIDQNNFIFDILGLSTGLYVSYLLNESNSNTLKTAVFISNLLVNNVISSYLSLIF